VRVFDFLERHKELSVSDHETDAGDTGTDPLSSDELDTVAGGNFHPEVQPSVPVDRTIVKGEPTAIHPTVSTGCLNPQPLPP
jgi:hypothetical protein